MSATPMVNPLHSKVKAAADAFIADYLKTEKHEAEKNRKADFCFCASAMASHADAEALRTMVDWLNWRTSPDVQTQFKITHKRYLDGLLHQVEATRDGDGQPRTEEGYIRIRRRTVGGYPCISLIDYAHNVNLSQEAFEHPSVQECIAVGCDLAWIHNDIVSYKKDVKSGIEHNIVTVLKKNGFTTQQAMDRAGELQDECYRRWYLALTSMPVWGEATDREVLRCIEACHSFPLGDLLWSFQIGRYLGATEGYKLHETKVLDLSDLEPIAA
ncbi:(+)-eremophilene synthase [Fusarium oxysporum]|nr:(+)-eremophilene synthase [Fusarium oxysporum f. sp. raphani]KAJ4039478.1 (+)-eremophilene synthase [Fusarium oxysporum]WKT46609.1 hypothetical protein QSH57_011483 [Fusarium oxysporum f. sp. vasinfectum]KAJ4044940.1 (+)-eremophilene synthase [Fusarium oxysporum]KAJ4046129.1 (+)-eremophilene synthase [Fusarium oxysporum]